MWLCTRMLSATIIKQPLARWEKCEKGQMAK